MRIGFSLSKKIFLKKAFVWGRGMFVFDNFMEFGTLFFFLIIKMSLFLKQDVRREDKLKAFFNVTI